MPYRDSGLIAFIADWWQFGAYIIAGVILYVTGRERQRYKVDAVGRDVTALKEAVAEIKAGLASENKDHNAEAISTAKALAEISAGQVHILKEVAGFKTDLSELRKEIKEKADK